MFPHRSHVRSAANGSCRGALAAFIIFAAFLAGVPKRLHGRVKPELMQCYLEINTEVCQTVSEAEGDLRQKIRAVEKVTDEAGLLLYWTGTHPFSN